ncbi:MAG: DegT/DnrJ/EryC1/StrS family aminotransferase [Aggregatilineales bacterium]
MDKIQVFKPAYSEEEVEAVAEVIRSGWWGQGPKTAELEQRFAEFVDAPHAVSVNSATAALHLALMLLDVKDAEVISTSLTFVSTNHAILYNGGIPVFADIDPETLCIDPEDIARKITPRTKAIMAVHYGGHAADMDRIHDIARAHNLTVIEDAAHAAGASYKGQMIGSTSPLTCFSFHPVKNLATGDGGMITLRDSEWDRRLRKLRWVGISKDTWSRSDTGDVSQYSWYYNVEELGFKYHMNDIMAAIALVQLRRLPETNARRQAIAGMYDAALADLAWLKLPVVRDYAGTARHNYVVRLDDRDGFMAYLRDKGIATGMHYIPNHLYDMYRPYVTAPLPVTEREWKRLVTLPLYPDLTDDQVQHIIDAIRAYPVKRASGETLGAAKA